MNRNRIKILGECCLEVIKQEGLPKPRKISFRIGGYLHRRGTLYRKHSLSDSDKDKYHIIIYLAKAKFICDNTGRYNNEYGTRLRKMVGGEKIPFPKIIKTSAHEIAHLKFFNHGAQHRSYTDTILIKLKTALEEKGISYE